MPKQIKGRKAPEPGMPDVTDIVIPGGKGCDPYFEWLVELVKGEYYHELLWALFDIPFHSNNDLDDVRVDHAIELREEYDKRYVGRIVEDITVLEVMVSMAVRCEKAVMSDPSKGDRTVDWFYMMIDNLGFSRMTDDKFGSVELVIVDTVIEDWLNRKFKKNGLGSPFPLANPGRRDCRKADLWQAMMWYMSENYITGGDGEDV